MIQEQEMIRDILKEVAEGNNILLLWGRRTGKTTTTAKLYKGLQEIFSNVVFSTRNMKMRREIERNFDIYKKVRTPEEVRGLTDHTIITDEYIPVGLLSRNQVISAYTPLPEDTVSIKKGYNILYRSANIPEAIQGYFPNLGTDYFALLSDEEFKDVWGDKFWQKEHIK